MSDESAKLKLPYIAAAQAQKHVTHNEAITALDTLVQLSVLDKDLATPPGSPAEGDCYIVASGGTDAWLGWDHRVVRFIDGEWQSYVPNAGWLAFVIDEAALYSFEGSAWNAFSGGSGGELADLTDVTLTSLADGQVLVWNASASKWENVNPSGGGSGSPGGSDTEVQFNDGGSFGGDAGLTYDKSTGNLSLGTTSFSPANQATAFFAAPDSSKSTRVTIRATAHNDNTGTGDPVLSIEASGGGQVAFIRCDGVYGAALFDTLDDSTAALVDTSSVTGSDPAGLNFGQHAILCWSANNAWWNSKDLFLQRDDAGILGQRNGSNGQAIRIYGSFTDGGNFERLTLDAENGTAGVFRIRSEAEGGDFAQRVIAIDGYTKSGAPSASDIPAGSFAVIKDSSGGTTKLVYNDGGTLKSVTLT